jgi:hypothetical protein
VHRYEDEGIRECHIWFDISLTLQAGPTVGNYLQFPRNQTGFHLSRPICPVSFILFYLIKVLKCHRQHRLLLKSLMILDLTEGEVQNNQRLFLGG